MEAMKLRTSEIVFNKDLYPRFELDNNAVERYRANLDELPPIVVSKNYILIDGKHRLRAHQLEKVAEIDVEILDTTDEDVIREESILRNSAHGKQLLREEKKALARNLWEAWGEDKLKKVLAVSQRVLYEWTEDVRKEIKNERDTEIVSLYLQCLTHEQVAEEMNRLLPENGKKLKQQTISNVLQKIAELQKLVKPPESLQFYDIWQFQALDKQYGQDYPGRIPGQIVENVLWYFTKPLDTVCDPMAGGGTTIDVCDAMYRRSFGYDMNPVHDRVQEYDMTKGVPDDAPKADLVFYDPPYFKKKTKEYNLPEVLNTKAGFMDFAQSWVSFAKQILKPHGMVALLISDYVDYENPDESIFSDEYARLFDKAFTRLYKISVPLSTQQYRGFHVDRAKENKQLLIRGRELYIFKKGR